MKLRGQGSLEYLIIIAAVLAIAAIVVLFLTGAFTSTTSTGGISVCKESASKCATERATSVGATCSYCNTACQEADGTDIVNTITFGGIDYKIGTELCKVGKADWISSGATACGDGIVEDWEACETDSDCTDPAMPTCTACACVA
jgi:hypothetical protein